MNGNATDGQDNPGSYDLHGTISSVDTINNTVTISPNDGGSSITLNVNSSTVITRDGLPATLSELQFGDNVDANYNSSTMIASAISAEASTETDIDGTISAVDTTAGTVSITPEDGGSDIVLTVNSGTVILLDGDPAALTDLQVGFDVEAKYDYSTMTAMFIEADSQSKVQGVITAVDTSADTVTITPDEQGGSSNKPNCDVVLTVNSSTAITLNGNPATLNKLQVGFGAVAKYDASTMIATKIDADSNAEVHGTISEVDTTADTVTITPDEQGDGSSNKPNCDDIDLNSKLKHSHHA